MTDSKKQAFFDKLHQEIANDHSTTPFAIQYIRSRAGNNLSLTEIKDGVEEQLTKIQQTVEEQRLAIQRRSDPEWMRKKKVTKEEVEKRNNATQVHVDLAMKKKAQFLDLYTFLHRLNDKKFSEITRSVEYGTKTTDR